MPPLVVAAVEVEVELEVAGPEKEVVVVLAATREIDGAAAASTKAGGEMEADSRHLQRIVIDQSELEIKVVVQEEKEPEVEEGAAAVPDFNDAVAVAVAEPPQNKSENSKLNERAKKTRRRGPPKLLLLLLQQHRQKNKRNVVPKLLQNQYDVVSFKVNTNNRCKMQLHPWKVLCWQRNEDRTVVTNYAPMLFLLLLRHLPNHHFNHHATYSNNPRKISNPT